MTLCPPTPIERLSQAQARRIALAAQGFGTPRPNSTPDRRALRRVLNHTGLLQIDSVNVLARAHYLPLFSRLGPYPNELLERAAYTEHRAPAARTVRVLGARGVAAADRDPAALSLAHGRWPAQRAGAAYVASLRTVPDFVAQRTRTMSASTDRCPQGELVDVARRRTSQAQRALVGLGRRQGRPRVLVLVGRDHDVVTTRLRAAL